MRIMLKSQEQNPYSEYNDDLIRSRYFSMNEDEVVSAKCNYTRIFTGNRWGDRFDATYTFYKQKWELPRDMIGVTEKENIEAQRGYQYNIYSPLLNRWIRRDEFVEAHSLPKKELK